MNKKDSIIGKINTGCISISGSANLLKYVAYDKRNGLILGSSGTLIRVYDNNGTLVMQDKSSLNNNGTAVATSIQAADYASRNHVVFGGAAGHIKNLETEKQFTSLFWYDKLGRMVVSQNTKQYNKATKAYSYTQYDALGRITEVGEIAQSASINNQYVNKQLSDALFATWISGGARTEVTQTYYDEQFAPGGILAQVNLRKRVASVTYEDVYDNNSTTYQSATHYTYDIHGNVNRMAQEIKESRLLATGLNVKYIDYEYDLVSGKVNKVGYNVGSKDQYYHQYEYDGDNRITKVFTSKDNIWWDNDAKYSYYNHGPLARTVIGDLEVQGMDYAYTLHGWLKGVNSNTMQADRDMGKDGAPGSTRQYVARDAMGYTLGYYAGDYSGIKAIPFLQQFEATNTGSDLMAARQDLFNGNISHMETAMPNVSSYNATRTISPSVRGGAYKYDQLNRLMEARSFFNVNLATNAWQSGGGSPIDYLENFTYDAMGNILHANRWGNGGLQMDNMDYKYNTSTAIATMGNLLSNRLYHVNDGANATNYTDDIDDQGVSFNNVPIDPLVTSNVNTVNNYGYDELGNLKRDNAEQIANIEWTVYGKIKKVTRTGVSTKPDLEFIYDAGGNRICKIVMPKPLSVATYKYSYYLRDAQGNEMANYELNMLNTTTVKDLTVTARPIYGSSRLGVDNRKTILWLNGSNVSIDTPSVIKYRTLSLKSYELSNHLGNVLVTVSDKRIAKTYGINTVDYFEPEITTISDYYAFGSPMPTRSWNDPNAKYKYGFNGKEKDKDDEGMGGGGSTYDYGFRIYNSNLGKFLSVDPLCKSYPWYTPYQFAGNKPIRCVDIDGLEELSVTIENNPAQPFISQATIVITMQYTVVTSGRGAVSGLDPKAFHDKYALGNTTLIMSQLPSAGHEGVALIGYQLKWARKAIAGNERAMRRLKKDGIDHLYKTEIQYDYTLDVSPNTTLEGALAKMSENIQGRGIIMNLIDDAKMVESDGANLRNFMSHANSAFNSPDDGGVASGEGYFDYIDNYIVLNPNTTMNLSKTDIAVHEAGHNASRLNNHTRSQTGNYEYGQTGLQNNGVGNGGTLIYPTLQNTINIINDLSNRAKTAPFAITKNQQ